MKYVKSFESHRKSKLTEPVNEGLFGGILNFFKGSEQTKHHYGQWLWLSW